MTIDQDALHTITYVNSDESSNSQISTKLSGSSYSPSSNGKVEETIITDPDTGARKAQRLARFDLIPAFPLWQLAEHYGKGCKKYSGRNWEKGYDWSFSYDSLNHHLNLFWQGEDIDPETGSLHIIAVAWHAFALAEFFNTHPEKDNRPERNDPLAIHKTQTS